MESKTNWNFEEIGLLHRIAFCYAWSGFRGSSYIWKAVYFIKAIKNGKYELPNRIRVVIEDLDWTARSIYEGTYERELLKFLMTINLNGRAYIDIGANIGSTLLPIANNHLIEDIFGFEPTDRCFLALAQTCFDKSNVKLIKKAVSSKTGKLEIIGDGNPLHSGLANSRNVKDKALDTILQVESVALDDFYEGRGLASRLLIKIDTEGHEPEVIEGLQRLVERSLIEMVIIEYSPMWNQADYLINLASRLQMSTNPQFIVITASGFFRKKLKLQEKNIEDLRKIKSQSNIIIATKESLEKIKQLESRRGERIVENTR